jgi:uncharacterized small protein (TIGR04563 family)
VRGRDRVAPTDEPRKTPNRGKQNVYFSDATIAAEIAREATRLGRSLSWVVQRAWMRARKEIMKAPSSIRDSSVVPLSVVKVPKAANVVGIVVELDRHVAPVGALPEQGEGRELHLDSLTAQEP